MQRTVVYPRPTSAAAVGTHDVGGGAPSAPTPDGLDDKLIKYIPAEVLAFFVPAVAIVLPESEPEAQSALGVATVFFAGLLATVLYLFVRTDKAEPPRPYFYFLAAVAFALWAVGTTSIETVLADDVPGWIDGLALPLAILLVPLADELLTKLTTK